MTDPYRTLGVSTDATPAQVKKAYRRLARRHHPDRDPAPDAAERFKAIAEAYALLSDGRRRRSWDRTGRRDRERKPASAGLQTFLRVFDQQLALMRGLFFEEILPRMIDRHFRGKGVELLVCLLDAVEQHRLLEHATGEALSDAARERAAAVVAGCPVSSRPVEMVDGAGQRVLGALLHELDPSDGDPLGVRYRIELFPGSFLAAGIRDPDALAASILPVLARECVRYLETFVSERDRPLTVRAEYEAGRLPDRLSVEVARQRDTAFLVVRWGGPALLLLLAIALVAAIAPGFVR